MKTNTQILVFAVSLALLIAFAAIPAAAQAQPAAGPEPQMGPPPAEGSAEFGPWGRNRHHGPARAAVGRGIGRILQALDLTEEQAEQVRNILSADAERAQSARKAVAEARKALHEAVMKGADEAAVRAAAATLTHAITENSVANSAKMASVRTVLTDEQLDQLDRLSAKRRPGGPMLGRRPAGPRGGYGCSEGGYRRGGGRNYGRGPGMNRRRGPGMEMFFDRCDADGDGAVTRQELEQCREGMNYPPAPRQ